MVEVKSGTAPEKETPLNEPEEKATAAETGKTSEKAGAERPEKIPAESPEEAPEEVTEETSKEETQKEASKEAASKEAAPKEAQKGLKKKGKKDKRDEKIEELNDRLMRNLAEFENFRTRSEKEKTAMFEIGAKSVLEKILPVVDNLERGFDALSEEEKETPFAKGIEAVYKQLLTALEEIGVTPIEALGQEFDPNLHNAVMHDEDDSGETNKVIEEFQKGYMYKDSVVRHSMFKVLN